MSINRDRVKGIIDINQTTYLENVLKRFNMFDCKPVSTPMECNKRFNKATENDNLFDVNIYQSAIGSLLYASIASRPDILFSVGVLSQFMSNPTQEHWSAVKRIFRYIKGTLNYSLQFVSSKANDITLYGYADVDWAGDFDTRKSTSEYVFISDNRLYCGVRNVNL